MSTTELDAFRSLTYKLRWPASKVVPLVAYDVGRATQLLGNATYEDGKQLNHVVERMKDLDGRGLASFTFRKLDLSAPSMIHWLDASLGNEGGTSQAGFLGVATDDGSLVRPTAANLAEFSTKRIPRVTRSTMASESASLSITLDRQFYTRLLWQHLLYGPAPVRQDWRYNLIARGILLTDAKAVYDHLHKDGSVPQERQTLLDLMAAREELEAGSVELRWVPSAQQLSDALTKGMDSPILEELQTHGMACLAPAAKQEKKEARLKALRQGQRQRRKASVNAKM